MRSHSFRRWACIMATCLAASAACAGSLLFDTSASTTFQDGQVTASVVVTNRGDEPALCVAIEAILKDQRVVSETIDVLDPGRSMRASFELGAAPAPPGAYTVVLNIRYSDVAGHSFTVVSSVPLFTADQDPRYSAVRGVLEPVLLEGREATTRLTITSLSNIAAQVSLILPDELGGTRPSHQQLLTSGMPHVSQWTISNRSAIPGSRYRVFTVLDYEESGTHHSLLVPGSVDIPLPWMERLSPSWTLVIVVPLILLLVALQLPGSSRQFPPFRPPDWAIRRLVTGAVFVVLLGFLLWHFPLQTLLMDTTCTGGDTPAHNYMARHLARQLLHHGRIISWAHGWWAGFPMFQYYFPLPYILMAVLDTVLPFNLAFKMVSVLGIFILPPCAFIFARQLRLPAPTPILLAIAMIPFLFVRTHTMWGVNIYSTLAGMLANSLSFPIMLLFVGSAFRDSDQGRFRVRTVLLLALLVSSHFFTSIVAGLTLLILPFLRPSSGLRRSLRVLAAEAVCGFMLMGWWIIPLMAKNEFSIDFGHDWNVKLHQTFPSYTLALFPFLAVALAVTIRRRFYPLMMIEWMFLGSVALFYWGSRVSTVFDNIRLWPFIFFGLLTLASAGIAFLLARIRGQAIGVAVVLVAALTWGIDQPNHVRQWVKWNQEGLESKPGWPVFERLVLPLDGTPGRLANDLHPDNNSLGSSRVFETVPALVNKPILEGGIVNSAVGSMYSYYIQGETSRSCAGFPNIVQPTSFNIANATRHLELFNVKHFIARSPQTRDALALSPEWKHLASCQRWDLFELTSHDGRYVYIPRHRPVPVRLLERPAGLAWKQASLDWIYRIEALEQPFILLQPGEDAPSTFDPLLNSASYQDSLKALRDGRPPSFKSTSLSAAGTASITNEQIDEDGSIRFRTAALGEPHIIKCSYFPNWRVRGAPHVYRVTPDFLLVYPDQPDVLLYYGRTLADNLGLSLTGCAAACLAGFGLWKCRRRARPT